MDYQNEILDWTLATLDAWGSALVRDDPSLDWWAKKHESPRDNLPAYQFAHFGAKFRPAEWLDRNLSQAERQGFSRGVKELTRLGLVVPVCRYGNRTSHIQFTPQGVVAAIVLAGTGDLAGIKKALSVAEWGTAEHLKAVKAAAKEATVDA